MNTASVVSMSTAKPEPVPRLRQLEFRAQVASAVREMREQQGLSQVAFSAIVGLSADDIEAIEDSDYCKTDLLEVLEKIRAIVGQQP